MYEKVKILELSKYQISRLLNGHPVRIKLASASNQVIEVSAEQLKKLKRAGKKGSASTITFDPYQIANHEHLRGGSIIKQVKNVARSIGKALKPHAEKMAKKQIAKLSGKAQDYLSQKVGADLARDLVNVGSNLANKGVSQVSDAVVGQGLFGKKFDRAVRKALGKQVQKGLYKGLEKTAKPLAKKAIGTLAGTASSLLPGPAGKLVKMAQNVAEGYLDNPSEYQKNVGKAMLEDSGIVEELENQLEGEGLKKRRGRKTRRGGALFPAGY